MSIFACLLDAAASGSITRLFDCVQSRRVAAERERTQVAFTIAAVALAAKMARADGRATEDEFRTFERLFRVPEAERTNAARFYRMAKSSIAGFETYAKQAAEILGRGSPAAEDLCAALLEIAATDGVTGPELDYLARVAERLGVGEDAMAALRWARLGPAAGDAWSALGLRPGADAAAVKAAYRRLVKAHHPDRHLAAGVPSEFIRVAEARMAAINAAYAELMARLVQRPAAQPAG